MSYLQTFELFPAISEQLSFLERFSRNLWWSWHHDAIELFRRINPGLWEASERNPIAFLSIVPQARFEELVNDSSFQGHLNRVRRRFETIQLMTSPKPASPFMEMQGTIAYFSMEFGIHESLPLYAGGLGILAGDHLKAASDMNLPLIGVGLLYRYGYFFQFLNSDGVQQEAYSEQDLYRLPVERAHNLSGNDLYVTVDGPLGEIRATVWKVMVGSIPLYLLDTNLSENPPEIRDITSMLYAVEQKSRLSQELLLGIGGMRALSAMGIYPSIVHMNEGHCTFAGLERLSQTMSRHSVDLKTAMEIVPRTTVFTTHTPVSAGHDEFPIEIVEPCLASFQKKLGISVDDILSLGKPADSGPDGPFCMFVLGVRLAQYCNGVSELHGRVARRMWTGVWDKRPEDEVPITYVTNGVHVSSWISYELAMLLGRYLGSNWSMNSWLNKNIINQIDEIYDEELWGAHEMSRMRLIRDCRELMKIQYARRNAPKAVMDDIENVLDQDALTIGFARRFASYKRSYLLFKDPERLEALITSDTHPIQFIFSGKAHPRDQEGKDLIQRVIQFCGRKNLRHRVIFLENYDPHIARHLVQGADVWLSTPRRPMEACGTSGMKAALNGVLNVSTLDGWWCEGYSEETGWRIGNGEEYTDYAYQDVVESQSLYNILENDVIPLFYEKKNGGVPSKWIKMMKASMKIAFQRFSSHKMVAEYGKRFYIPAARQLDDLIKNDAEEAKRLSAQRKRLQANWNKIYIKPPAIEIKEHFRVGDNIQVTAEVFLGELSPDEVVVEAYYGPLKTGEKITTSHVKPMTVQENRGEGNYFYGCALACEMSGCYGFTARITPNGDDWFKFTPSFLTWAQPK